MCFCFECTITHKHIILFFLLLYFFLSSVLNSSFSINSSASILLHCYNLHFKFFDLVILLLDSSFILIYFTLLVAFQLLEPILNGVVLILNVFCLNYELVFRLSQLLNSLISDTKFLLQKYIVFLFPSRNKKYFLFLFSHKLWE